MSFSGLEPVPSIPGSLLVQGLCTWQCTSRERRICTSFRQLVHGHPLPHILAVQIVDNLKTLITTT